MNVNSKLREIKREMDKIEKQMSAQHTSIIRSLDEKDDDVLIKYFCSIHNQTRNMAPVFDI